MEQQHWHEAYGPGPCGCPYDADALIDDETGELVALRCRVCGDRRPAFPAQHEGDEG